MKTTTTQLERVISLMGTIFVFVSFIASVLLNGDPDSILELIPIHVGNQPLTSILLPIIHGAIFLVGITCVVKPGIKRIYWLLLIESFLTIVTNYEQLGIFFFYASVILILINEQFSTKSFKKIIVLSVFHFISIILMFTHGWPKTFVALFTSLFYATFFICVYQFLKTQFCILPANVTDHKLLKTDRGEKLLLSDPKFKLTERQINLIYDYMTENMNYRDLSEKYFISISTVKKEFSSVFHIFEVDNISELKILLLQFQVSK